MSYNHSIGNEAFYYAFGAYCGKDEILRWTHGLTEGPESTKQFQVLNVTNSKDPKGVLQSYIGLDHANYRIIIAFRGTANPDNWKSDLDAIQMDYPYAITDPPSKVHKGFYEAWEELQQAGLTQAIKDALKQKPAYTYVLVTGHSLGAALAGIAALELKQSPVFESLREQIDQVDLITFGAPRWCNQALSQLFAEKINSSWRIVNRNDPVPALPPRNRFIRFYYHVVTEIWYNYEKEENPLTFKICNASGGSNDVDPACRRANPTTGADHSNYFAINRSGLCNEPQRTTIRPTIGQTTGTITTGHRSIQPTASQQTDRLTISPQTMAAPATTDAMNITNTAFIGILIAFFIFGCFKAFLIQRYCCKRRR